MTILSPLKYNVPIVEKDGTPTREFLQKWNAQAKINGTIPDLNTAAEVSALLDLLGGANNDYLQRASGLWAPKTPPGDATKFLNGAAPGAWAQVKGSDLSMADVVNNNVTSTAHGFAPKAPADATAFLNGAASPAYAQVKDSDLSTSNITTNDVSTAKHGFTPKLPNDVTKFLNGIGGYTVPPGSGGSGGVNFSTIGGQQGDDSLLFATEGARINPVLAATVSKLGFLFGVSTSITVFAAIYSIANAGSGVITAINATSSPVTFAPTAGQYVEFTLGTPFTFVAGNHYVLALTRTDATATTTNHMWWGNTFLSNTFPDLSTGSRDCRLASLLPIVGSTFSLNGNSRWFSIRWV